MGSVDLTLMFLAFAAINVALCVALVVAVLKYNADNIEDKFEKCFGTGAAKTKKYLKDSLIAGAVLTGLLGLAFLFFAFHAYGRKAKMQVNV